MIDIKFEIYENIQVTLIPKLIKKDESKIIYKNTI